MRWQLVVAFAVAAAEEETLCADDACRFEIDGEEVPASSFLLQTSLRHRPSLREAGDRDLVFMHVPFNFGHTVEKVAAVGSGQQSMFKFSEALDKLGAWDGSIRMKEESARNLTREFNLAWGHVSPLLQERNNVTGCPMYFSPQKYWPEDLAKEYFGDKTVFGVLRDPYERLVAFFRGNTPTYGFSDPELFATCDVNNAVKRVMKRYLAGGQAFANACSFVPQAEFFDGAHGITLPVDNREFPSSMNEVFREHGYGEMQIGNDDIFHVQGCSEVWSGDFDNETRALVREVYKRDFELLCRYFGYCDPEEDTCIWQVPTMCPQRVLQSRHPSVLHRS